MTGSVFLSYTRDDSAYVRRLAAYLRRAGIPVWMDDEIDYGEHWETVVCSQIDGCGAFVPIMTPAAEKSTWVAREIIRAEHGKKPILPLLVAGRPMLRLGDLHCEDVTHGGMPADAFVARLRALTATPDPGRPDPAPSRRPLRQRRVLAALAGVLTVAIVATVVIVVTMQTRNDPARGGLQAPSSTGLSIPAAGTSAPAGEDTTSTAPGQVAIETEYHVCRSEAQFSQEPTGAILMTTSPARVTTSNGHTVDVTGICGAWYVPVAGTRYVNTGLKLTNGVFIDFDDMTSFEVTQVIPTEAATDDYRSPEQIFVTIATRNGNTVTGEIDLSAQQWSIAGPSTVAGDFETPLHHLRRVEFLT